MIKINEQLKSPELETDNEEEEVLERNSLTLQHFMNDMSSLGRDVNSRNLDKPTFHYGDLSITNYLLWLLLGEIMLMNNKLNEEKK